MTHYTLVSVELLAGAEALGDGVVHCPLVDEAIRQAVQAMEARTGRALPYVCVKPLSNMDGGRVRLLLELDADA